MASMTRIAEPGASWLRAAAALLALGGFLVLFYSSILPAPDVVNLRLAIPLYGSMSVAWAALGLARLLAAVGVTRRLAWARVLGVVLTVPALVLDGIGLLPAIAGADLMALTVAGLSVAADLIVLFALLRRWPGASPVRPASRPRPAGR